MTLTDRKAEVAKAFGEFMARRALGQPLEEHSAHLAKKLDELRKAVSDLSKELDEALSTAAFIEANHRDARRISGDGHTSEREIELRV
jgi:seryl-tRNA synthetase